MVMTLPMRVSVIEEFARVWDIVTRHRLAVVQVQIPESKLLVRAYLVRVDRCPGAPRLVSMHVVLHDLSLDRELADYARATSRELEAMLICRDAVQLLVESSGARLRHRALD
jgi:hypothetical protein